MANYIIDLVIKGMNKLVKVRKDVVDIDKHTKDVVKSMDKLSDSSGGVIPKVGGINKKLDDMTDSLSHITNVGLGGVSKALSGIGTKIKSLVVLLRPFMLLIGVITGLVFMFKRAWDRNIGGIAVMWNKFTSRIRITWNKLMLQFDKALQALGPLFKFTFQVLINILEPVFLGVMKIIETFNKMPKTLRIVTGVLMGVVVALSLISAHPIIGAVGALLILFSVLPKPIRILIVVLGGLAAILWAISVTPIVLIIGAIVAGVTLLILGIKKLVGWLSKFKVVTTIFKGFKLALDMILFPIKVIVEGIKLITKFFGKKEKKELEISETRRGGGMINRAGVIGGIHGVPSTATTNNNVTINSAGPINEEQAPKLGKILVARVQSSALPG